jgi:hypothetical protein
MKGNSPTKILASNTSDTSNLNMNSDLASRMLNTVSNSGRSSALKRTDIQTIIDEAYKTEMQKNSDQEFFN